MIKTEGQLDSQKAYDLLYSFYQGVTGKYLKY